MHQRAEWGVAAHWSYKEGSPSDDIAWLNRIDRLAAETQRSRPVFMETLKTDLEQDEVFVFTPEGQGHHRCRSAPRRSTSPTRSTPRSATPASASRVNGRLVPLDYRLQSGDTCEIFTSKVEGAGPSRDWLKIVQSPRARNKIRQWFSRERRDDALETGARGARQGAAPRGPAGAEDPAAPTCWPRKPSS